MLLLLAVALILAWPTAGLSLLVYGALFFVRAYFGAKIRRRRASTISAIREIQEGKVRLPSWVNDSTQSPAFIGATISEADRKGVPQSFIKSHFRSDENKATLLCLAGLMEEKGFSIREQGIAATDFICDVWERQSQVVARRLRELAELLTDARVRYEILSLIEYGTMYHGDEEVAPMLDRCLGAAEEVSAITGQEVVQVLAAAVGSPVAQGNGEVSISPARKRDFAPAAPKRRVHSDPKIDRLLKLCHRLRTDDLAFDQYQILAKEVDATLSKDGFFGSTYVISRGNTVTTFNNLPALKPWFTTHVLPVIESTP